MKSNMKFIVLLMLVLMSCKHNNATTDYAIEWSKDIKSHILADVSVSVDSTSIDTLSEKLLILKLFHHGNMTKEFYMKNNDTFVSLFYSPTGDFKLVRELCPKNSRNFEGITFKDAHIGLFELRYCDGSLKKQGFRFNGDVGIWKEWDSTGKLIREWDNSNEDKLNGLKQIHYR